MYFIKSGNGRGMQKRDSATGIDFLIAARGEGSAFGEMSRLTENRVPRRSRTRNRHSFHDGRADFRNLLVEDPAVNAWLGAHAGGTAGEAAKQVRYRLRQTSVSSVWIASSGLVCPVIDASTTKGVR